MGVVCTLYTGSCHISMIPALVLINSEHINSEHINSEHINLYLHKACVYSIYFTTVKNRLVDFI